MNPGILPKSQPLRPGAGGTPVLTYSPRLAQHGLGRRVREAWGSQKDVHPGQAHRSPCSLRGFKRCPPSLGN